MRPRVIQKAMATELRITGNNHYETQSRGLAVLNSPRLNKGTAFTVKNESLWGSQVCCHQRSPR